MNTQRSDQVQKEWSRTINPLKRATAVCQRTFMTSAESLFALLCPTTEYDWLPGWSCELLHSDSGYAEYNVVIRTSFFGAEEIWVCTRYEPNKAIEYARTSENQCGKMEISLVDHGDGTVTGRWVLTASALNEDGNEAVDELASAGKQIDEILGVLDH
ncbi:MAG: hypothetical protein OEV68_05125, partial [candidate division Zixibacteria bacterium]|nr:hypothetical protein [candidate division Zixibacteria bacterium]